MKKIFVNGSFDIVHIGHINLLKFAKNLGDYLLVAIDSDSRIKQLKGDSRPFNDVYERKTLLQNMKMVDEVLVFGDDLDYENILKAYRPDVIVKGSDHKYTSTKAAKYCDEVVFYERFGGFSSTEKIQNFIAG